MILISFIIFFISVKIILFTLRFLIRRCQDFCVTLFTLKIRYSTLYFRFKFVFHPYKRNEFWFYLCKKSFFDFLSKHILRKKKNHWYFTRWPKIFYLSLLLCHTLKKFHCKLALRVYIYFHIIIYFIILSFK